MTKPVHIRPRAFTLIELLVVITIIVVLLALLAPALDKAIYQAELARDGAQHRGVATGVLTYAMGHNRAYPSPSGGRGYNFHTDLLGWESNPTQDLRPILRDVVALPALVCPLTEEIQLDEGSNGPDTQVHSTYDLWFGWQFQLTAGESAMRRVGDRFSYQNNRFSLLTSDVNIYLEVGGPHSQSAHPDKDGLLAQEVYRDQYIGPGGVGLVPGGTSLTFSRWTGFVQRGPIDMNVSRTDGAVQTYHDLPYGPVEELRFVPVPPHNTADPGPKVYIPAD